MCFFIMNPLNKKILQQAKGYGAFWNSDEGQWYFEIPVTTAVWYEYICDFYRW